MFKFLWCTIIISIVSSNIFADPVKHQIEFIIFQQSAAIKQHDAIKHFARLNNKHALNYKKLNKIPATQLSLSNEVKQLQASSNYKILQHISWEDTINYKFNSGVYFNINNDKSNSNSGVTKLEGTIHYKHNSNIYGVKLDVVFYLKQNNIPIRLTQSAKIKKGELFYFDDPNFGVLLKLDTFVPNNMA